VRRQGLEPRTVALESDTVGLPTCGVASSTAVYKAIHSPQLSVVDPWRLVVCVPSVPQHKSPPGGLPGGAMWRWLLGLQQPHVGGLGALRPRRDVELDGLPLIK
jgi:hypothetical protein